MDRSTPRVEGPGEPGAPTITVENVLHWCRYQEALLQFRLNQARREVGLPPLPTQGGQR